MIIRPEQSADFDAIGDVVEAAFGKPDERRVIERIRASALYVPELALVAVDEDGAISGHIMFSYVTLEAPEGELPVLQLAPLAVRPDVQSQGIGGALIRAGVERAEARREPLIALLGHPGYYPRFGFEPASQHGIEPPHPIMAPAFQVLKLSAYDERYRGRVVFSPAFNVT